MTNDRSSKQGTRVDPLTEHYAGTLRLIEAMAIEAAMASVPKLPFGMKLGEPRGWDEHQLSTVAGLLAQGARMAAAEQRGRRAS